MQKTTQDDVGIIRLSRVRTLPLSGLWWIQGLSQERTPVRLTRTSLGDGGKPSHVNTGKYRNISIDIFMEISPSPTVIYHHVTVTGAQQNRIPCPPWLFFIGLTVTINRTHQKNMERQKTQTIKNNQDKQEPLKMKIKQALVRTELLLSPDNTFSHFNLLFT